MRAKNQSERAKKKLKEFDPFTATSFGLVNGAAASIAMGNKSSAIAYGAAAAGIALGQLIGVLIATNSGSSKYKPKPLFVSVKPLGDEVCLQLRKSSNGARQSYTAATKLIDKLRLPCDIEDAGNSTFEKYWYIYVECDSNKTAAKLAKAISSLKATEATDLKDDDILNSEFVIDKDANAVRLNDED